MASEFTLAKKEKRQPCRPVLNLFFPIHCCYKCVDIYDIWNVGWIMIWERLDKRQIHSCKFAITEWHSPICSTFWDVMLQWSMNKHINEVPVAAADGNEQHSWHFLFLYVVISSEMARSSFGHELRFLTALLFSFHTFLPLCAPTYLDVSSFHTLSVPTAVNNHTRPWCSKHSESESPFT